MGKKIHIAHIINSFEMGGLEKLLVYFLKELDHNRFKSSVIGLENIGDLKSSFESLKVSVFALQKRKGTDLSLIKKISQIIKEQNIHLIHTHNLGSHFYGSLAAIMSGLKPRVHSQHGIETHFGIKEYLKHQYLNNKNDYFICVSKGVENFVRNKWRPRCNLLTIHNGISSSFKNIQITQNVRAQIGIPKNSKVIGHVGRLSEVKDQSTLINAFHLLLQKDNNVSLIIIGDGPLKTTLEAIANDLGIGEKVYFLGFRNDIRDILNILDVFVLSSLYEGISVALLEAMITSIPVVVTEVGGNIEIIKHQINGLVVPPKNPLELAEAIKKILIDKNLSFSLAKTAHETVESKFSMKAMVDSYGEIYDECFRCNI